MKKRRNFTISIEAVKRMEYLFRNAYKLYGSNISRSKIIENLILNTTDPIEIIKNRKRELAKEMTRLTEEQIALEDLNGN